MVKPKGHARKTRKNTATERGFTRRFPGGKIAHAETVRTAKKTAERLERQKKAWALLVAGATFAQIGEELGVSAKTAWYDCVEARERMNGEAALDHGMRLERQGARLDHLWRVHHAGKGKEAAAVKLAVLAHEAKLYGLYPQKRDYSLEQVVGLLRAMSSVFSDALSAAQEAYGLTPAGAAELRRIFAAGIRRRAGTAVAIEAKAVEEPTDDRGDGGAT